MNEKSHEPLSTKNMNSKSLIDYESKIRRKLTDRSTLTPKVGKEIYSLEV